MCANLKKYWNGKIEEIPYKDVVIICRKDRKNLKPNISITKDFLSIAETIQGNVIIVCKENKEFKSISKEQAVEYVYFLKNASFHCDNANIDSFNLLNNKDLFNNFANVNKKNLNDETLKMILGIQAVILKFIKNFEN